jgi:hypothetical protein
VDERIETSPSIIGDVFLPPLEVLQSGSEGGEDGDEKMGYVADVG